MSTPAKKYWFPRKTFGWGWGLPSCWQGWVVMLSYIMLLIGGSFGLKHSPKSAAFFVIYSVGLSVVLVAVCWWKGEPPQWRWGLDQETAEKK